MANLIIRKFPDQFLRKKAAKVDRLSDFEKKTLGDMAEKMYLSGGVGLAAIQVGIDKQLAVIDVGDGLVKLINPTIIKREGRQIEEEGCLSVPDTLVKVKRAQKVVISYLNEKGDTSQISAEGLFSRAIQHEIDHLSGRLIIDHLNPIKRLFLRRQKNLDKIPKI